MNNESLLTVKVIPRAKQNSVAEKNGEFVIHVTAPADDGKANVAALKLLAGYLHLPVSALGIVRGATSRRKTIRVGS